MRHLRVFPLNDLCSETCPEYLEMVADGPVDEYDWYICQNHRQWWHYVMGDGQMELIQADRPPQLLLRRFAILEAAQP